MRRTSEMNSEKTRGTSNHEEISFRNFTDERESCCQDVQHEDVIGGASGDAEDSPGKFLIQSVTEILSQSAQSVKYFVSSNASSTPSDENAGAKTLLQSVGEKFMLSAQSVKDVVSGSPPCPESSDTDGGAVENEDENEKTMVQTVQERLAQTTHSVKEAITGGIAEEDVEKGVLQVMGEKIAQSAKTVKDAVKGDVHIAPGDDETAELSILVHTILD